jgi:hypothetical protein
VIHTPIRALRANAITERWTTRRECLDRMLTLSRRHLQATRHAYAAHYTATARIGRSALCSPRHAHAFVLHDVLCFVKLRSGVDVIASHAPCIRRG